MRDYQVMVWLALLTDVYVSEDGQFKQFYGYTLRIGDRSIEVIDNRNVNRRWRKRFPTSYPFSVTDNRSKFVIWPRNEAGLKRYVMNAIAQERAKG